MTEECIDCQAGRAICPGPHPKDHEHTEDPLCTGCVLRLKSALESLSELYVAASIALSTGTGNVEKVSGSRTPPLPLNAGASVLMSRLLACVLDVVEDVCEAANLADPVVAGRDGVKITAACRTLSAHVDTLIGLPPTEHAVWTGEYDPDDGSDVWEVVMVSGVDAALRVIEEVRWARNWLGLTAGRDHLGGIRCPECPGKEPLYRTYGSDTIHCSECEARFSRETLERWTLMLAAQL